IGNALDQQIALREDLDHHDTSFPGTRQGPVGARIASAPHPESFERQNAAAPGYFSLAKLLHHLSMQREIETFALGILGDPQSDEDLDHEQDDQADNRVVNEDGGNADALIEELPDIALENTRGP